MSNSSLVDVRLLSPNYNPRRKGDVIDTVTIHCVVGQLTAVEIGRLFSNKERQASSNYGVGCDGSVGMYVEEGNRSWCSSNRDNDYRAITIEVACDIEHPYRVRGVVVDKLIELVTDICLRNNIDELKWRGDKQLIGQVDKQNMTVHRWFANKACPGDYLYGLHGFIAQKVNENMKNKKNSAVVERKKFENCEWGLRYWIEKGVINSSDYWVEKCKEVEWLGTLINATAAYSSAYSKSFTE